ncbi:MAG: efflux RND transporter periplasmic adaptor subunit [Candidatus Gracilibacteria bacterium]|nr:efflux RND transporter periplasmic adaptor subunit [Candidatus Gracilibacteria bacterium]
MKKKIIISGVILLSLGGYFLLTNGNSNEKDMILDEMPIQTVTAEKKSFDSNLSIIGTAKVRNEQRLRFNTSGKITKVNFKGGDIVKKGQIIAEIDSTEANNEVARAKLTLKNSQTKLEKFKDDISETGLKKSQIDLDKISSEINKKKLDIDLLKLTQNKDLKEAQLSLKEAENNYKILEKEVAKNINNYSLTDEDKEKILNTKNIELTKQKTEYNNLKNNFENTLNKKINDYYSKLEQNYLMIQSNITNTQKSFQEINGLFDSQSTFFSNQEEFSAKRPDLKLQARGSFEESKRKLEELKKSYKKITSKKDTENIIKALEENKKLNETLFKTTDLIAKSFQESVTSGSFNLSEINSYSSKYSSQRDTYKSETNSILSTIDELKTYDSTEKIKQDLLNNLEEKKNNIKAAELDIKKISENQNFLSQTSGFNTNNENIKLEKSRLNLELQKQKLETLKQTQKETLKQEELSYDKMKLEYKDAEKKTKKLINLDNNEEYTYLINEVKQNKIALQNTLKRLENYSIKAPFDGIITNMDINVGDRLNADTQKFISIQNPNLIEINMYVTQADIVKINKGMKASFVFDSYKNKKFDGVINKIENTPTNKNGVDKYKVQTYMNKPEGIKIYSGMRTNATITINKVPESIVVPYLAVSVNAKGEKIVTVIKKGGIEEQKVVKTGITDGKNYQILEGLKGGEKIILINYNGLEAKNNPAEKEKKTDIFGEGMEEGEFQDMEGEDMGGDMGGF